MSALLLTRPLEPTCGGVSASDWKFVSSPRAGTGFFISVSPVPSKAPCYLCVPFSWWRTAGLYPPAASGGTRSHRHTHTASSPESPSPLLQFSVPPQGQARGHTHTRPHTLSHVFAHTLSVSHTLTCAHTLCLLHTASYTFTHFTHSHPLPHPSSHTHSCIFTHTHTHTQPRVSRVSRVFSHGRI